MAREIKNKPFIELLAKAHDKAYAEETPGVEFNDCVFKVTVEALLKSNIKDLSDSNTKSIVLEGTAEMIFVLLYKTGLIEHTYSLTSNIKGEWAREPQFSIKDVEVVK